MRLPPPSVTSQWPVPNYIDPVDRGPALLVISLLLTILAALIVFLRIYTRLAISRSHGTDDVLIVLALVPAVGHTVMLLVVNIRYVTDRHIWDVPLADVVEARKLNIIVQICFALGCTLTKASMLFLTRRLMSSASKVYRGVILVGIVVVTVQGVIFCFVVVFQCSPISQYWTVISPSQASNCINESENLLAAGVINTLTDFIVVLLPIPLVWSLQLPMGRRVKVTSLLGVGILVCCAGIVRTIYTSKFTSTYDVTWEIWPVSIASTIELNVGIICASAPAIQPLIWRYFPGTRSAYLTRPGLSISGNATTNQSYGLNEMSGRSGMRKALKSMDKGDSESQTEIIPRSPSSLSQSRFAT